MATVRRVALGYNAVYLVEDAGERVLVDAGPDFAGAWEALSDGLAGITPQRVAVTHAHLDHAGLGARWSESGVPVLVGASDSRLVRQPALSSAAEYDAMLDYMSFTGAPPRAAQAMRDGLERRREWARRAACDPAYPATNDGRWPTGLRYRPFEPSFELSDGDPVGAGLHAIHCPGHTPGNLVLVHPAQGWLFSGDQLLPAITPTPAIQFDPATGERFHSLPNFVRSLERLQSIGFQRCFPGHGDPFGDVAGAIEANLAQVRQRGERLHAALRETGPASVYSLAEAVYPRALQRRFWQIIATVQGHLDLLEADGAVLRERSIYRLT